MKVAHFLAAMSCVLSLLISAAFSSLDLVAASALHTKRREDHMIPPLPLQWTYSLIASTAFLSFSLRNSSNMVALSSRYFSAASSFFSSAWREGGREGAFTKIY